MTRDGGALTAAAGGAGGGGGEGARRCSQCGHHGHNARTCTGRPVKLFGVRIGDKPMRKSMSMGNIAHLAVAPAATSPAVEGSGGGGGGAAREEGYASEDLGVSRRERKRGEAWTEEEHKKFLVGLTKLGKGDWRGISRGYVVTRTPTQVASHAQKYFIRQSNSHRRKRRSSLFDMVINQPTDQQLLRTSSHDLEDKEEHPQPVTAPVAPPVPAPMLPPASAPLPAPVLTIHPEEQESIASSSNNGEAGIPRQDFMPPYGYPMMLPPPYYPPAFVPVPCYGYVPFFCGPPDGAQASHEIFKPLAVHSKPPVNVEDLYSMSQLSLKGELSANSSQPTLSSPPKLIGGQERQSAFHARRHSDGSPNELIPAVQ